MTRIPVRRANKLYIGGAFPRSESGRTDEAQEQNVARASRKDVRDAVSAARGAQPKGATAYNRGQVLDRIAEMMEARVPEFARLCSARTRSIGRSTVWVWYAGLRRQALPGARRTILVAGPYFNFTIWSRPAWWRRSRPTSRRCSASSRESAPALTGGNAVVALASETQPLAAQSSCGGDRDERCPGWRRLTRSTGRRAVSPCLRAMDENAIDVTGADGDNAWISRRPRRRT